VLWFNTQRPHGSIDDLTPLEVEQLDYARNEPVGKAG
jgi:putative transposase